MYRDPGDNPISFGDIFESVHLIDIHVGSDASALGGGPMPRRAAERIAEHNNLELTDSGDMIPVYTPAMKQHPEKFHVLGRGSTMKLDAPIRAILLTDSCAVDTALTVDRRGRRAQGRLLFAPVVLTDDAHLKRLIEKPVFGRFPLPKAEIFDGAIAELNRCFMVDVRDVSLDDRILGLTEEASEELEVAWNAYALRRGPLVTERNVAKLASIIAGGSSDPSEPDGPAEMIGEALNVAWRLEGGSLRAAAESQQLDTETIDQLIADLVELEAATRKARERLSRVRAD